MLSAGKYDSPSREVDFYFTDESTLVHSFSLII